MSAPTPGPIPDPENLAGALAAAVERYRADADVGRLIREIERLSAAAGADDLMAAVAPFRDLPEVAGPVYERIVALRPDDASALVTLAAAYWMSGRGPEIVADLASRALTADPANRGAWHLWALAEPDIRARVGRWQQVARRFPDDELARANLADNAASLAGAEDDADALALAVATYESLRARARAPEQQAALDNALATLRSWRL